MQKSLWSHDSHVTRPTNSIGCPLNPYNHSQTYVPTPQLIQLPIIRQALLSLKYFKGVPYCGNHPIRAGRTSAHQTP